MRLKLVKLLVILSLPMLVILCNSKSVTLSSDDKKSIEAFTSKWNLPVNPDSVHTDFDREIQFISTIQNIIISGIRHEEVPMKYYGNVPFYLESRKGLCYDRAILMEKFFSHYGFSFRHLFIYFGEGGTAPTFTSLFSKKTKSHALLEIKTKKGWMALGTNAAWIGLTADGKILTIGQLQDKLQTGILHLKQTPDSANVFWNFTGKDFRYVYGLYSRHGNFFKSTNRLMSFFHFLPDYNLRMVLYNF